MRVIDCSELERAESPPTSHHVLNGIAHVPATDSFLVTGKRWNTMFEIALDRRDAQGISRSLA